VVDRLTKYVHFLALSHPFRWSRCLNGTKPKWLSWAKFWFNTNYNNSLKLTPFKSLYGGDPPYLLKAATILSAVEEVNVLTNDRDQMLHDLKGNLAKAQNQMKKIWCISSYNHTLVVFNSTFINQVC